MQNFILTFPILLELCDRDDGWYYFKGTNNCYKYFSRQQDFMEDQGLSWNDTQAKCEEQDANLVSFDTDSELGFIHETFLM